MHQRCAEHGKPLGCNGLKKASKIKTSGNFQLHLVANGIHDFAPIFAPICPHFAPII